MRFERETETSFLQQGELRSRLWQTQDLHGLDLCCPLDTSSRIWGSCGSSSSGSSSSFLPSGSQLWGYDLHTKTPEQGPYFCCSNSSNEFISMYFPIWNSFILEIRKIIYFFYPEPWVINYPRVLMRIKYKNICKSLRIVPDRSYSIRASYLNFY